MFTKDSQIVKDYVLLIQLGEKTIDDVPNFSNLRACVLEALAEAEANNSNAEENESV